MSAAAPTGTGRIPINLLVNPPSPPIPKNTSSESVCSSASEESIQAAAEVLSALAKLQPTPEANNFSASKSVPVNEEFLKKVANLQGMMFFYVPIIPVSPNGIYMQCFRYLDGTVLQMTPDNKQIYTFPDQSTFFLKDNVVDGPFYPVPLHNAYSLPPPAAHGNQAQVSPPVANGNPSPVPPPAATPVPPSAAHRSPASQRHSPYTRRGEGQPIVLRNHRSVELGASTQPGEAWRADANAKGLLGVFDYERSEPS